MILFLNIVLLVSIGLVIYNYLIYPSLISQLAKGKELSYETYTKENLPRIALVFAAYNEEKVIVQKLANLDELDYPIELLDIHVGLDHPDDRTAALIQENKPNKFPFEVHHFKERSGKANVLNKIFKYSLDLSDYEIVVMMDANIISKPNCLFELVKFFKNQEVGVVAAVIKNAIERGTEIAEQEQYYIAKESKMKVDEGLVFGSTIGAFGACYAIRSKYIKTIPSNFLMEDFFLSMHALDEGAISIANPDAIVYEDLPGKMEEEFKRKRRISTGNFQNLKAYAHLLWRNFRVGFPFFSHKVLRWLSPFFLLIAIVLSTVLFLWEPNCKFHRLMFVLMCANILLPFVDIVLKRLNISVNLLRLHRYFISMNIAMFLGFIDWVKGVKTNIWKPTERL